jgi:hypothetical protein
MARNKNEYVPKHHYLLHISSVICHVACLYAIATTSGSITLIFESDVLYITTLDVLPNDDIIFNLVTFPNLNLILFVD